MVIVSERSDRQRYHRSAECYYPAQMPARERIHLHDAREEGLGPCNRCAAEEREDAEAIEVCPECDKAQIQAIIGAANAPTGPDHDYRCNACGARFDEPTERAQKHDPGNPGGLAGALMEADPDDVSADNVGGGSA